MTWCWKISSWQTWSWQSWSWQTWSQQALCWQAWSQQKWSWQAWSWQTRSWQTWSCQTCTWHGLNSILKHSTRGLGLTFNLVFTEFAVLCKNPPFYEVKKIFRKRFWAWKNFKNIFSRPLFTVLFRPKILILVT